MTIKPILRYPNKLLRQETVDITVIDLGVEELYHALSDTMKAHDGAGLAAIQIGDPRKMFILDARLTGGNTEKPPVFINPVITEFSDEKDTDKEGCLSFPDIFASITRSAKITITYQNFEGMQTLEAEGFLARALQHETDHLNGKLMIDLLGSLKRSMINKKILKAKILKK